MYLNLKRLRAVERVQTTRGVATALRGTPREYGWELIRAGMPADSAERIVKAMQAEKADGN